MVDGIQNLCHTVLIIQKGLDDIGVMNSSIYYIQLTTREDGFVVRDRCSDRGRSGKDKNCLAKFRQKKLVFYTSSLYQSE